MSPPAAEIEPVDRPRPASRAWIKPAITSALCVLVFYAVARHAGKTWSDLEARGESIRIQRGPFAAAVGLYVLGLLPFGVFYGRVLNAGVTPIRGYAAVRAYFISHLGKYVPGKAFVVVLRVGLSSRSGARAATAAFASMYETLLMMAAGGLVAAVGFGWGAGSALTLPLPFSGGRAATVPLPLLGLGLGLAFLVVVEPRVFPRIARLARMPFPGVGPDALPRFSHRLMFEGLLWSALGWTLLGLSQVAILDAMVPGGLPASRWPTVIASVALATVAGFVVPIAPGGLGVREWVLWTALASAIDRDVAVFAALALRLAWVVGEVAAAVVLAATRPRAAAALP